MAKNLLLVSLSSILLALFGSIAGIGRFRFAARMFAAVSSLAHLVCAGWVCYYLLSAMNPTEVLDWEIFWFSFSETAVLKVYFVIENWSGLLWFSMALLAFIFDYYMSFRSSAERQGSHIARRLLVLGAFFTILAGNILTLYFGWALVSFAIFLGIALNGPGKEPCSKAAFHYYVFTLSAELLFILGVFGLFITHGHLSFTQINDAVVKSGGGPAWAVALVILGTLFRSFQLPLLTNSKHIGVAGPGSPFLYLLGHVVCSSALLTKLYPVVVATPGSEYFAIIPAITCLFSAALSISEKSWSQYIGLLATYLCGSVFLTILQHGFQAAQMQVIAGSFGLFLLSKSIEGFSTQWKYRNWFVAIGCFSILGSPMTSSGNGRYLEYLATISLAQGGFSFAWVTFSIKILADILMGIALWGTIRNSQKFEVIPHGTQTSVGWERFIPLILTGIFCISLVVGGRPFSGMVGEIGLNLSGKLSWFETLVSPPPLSSHVNANELLGSDADMLSRILLAVSFLFPGIISLAWLYRDQRSSQDFFNKWARVMKKINIERLFDFVIWDLAYRKIGKFSGQVFARFDSKILDYVFSKLFVGLIQRIYRFFQAIDLKVIDRFFVGGISQGVLSLGKGLKLIQNGQVQFYLAFGLILMTIIVVHSIFRFGG